MTRRDVERAWAAAPLLPASALIHAGAVVSAVAAPASWPWALGAVIANHAVITATGLWPRSRLLGPNWTRLPAANGSSIAITIDDGPHPDVTPRVLELLAARSVRATFFCIGEQVERHPGLAREILAAGHGIENHSQQHRHNFSLLGPSAMRTEIARAQDSIERVTGRAPRFFRAPAGLRNPFLEPALRGLRLRLASWTRRGFDTVNGDAEAVYRRLAKRLAARDILLLHDGHAAHSAAGLPVILEVLPRLLDAAAERRLTPIPLHAALTAEAA